MIFKPLELGQVVYLARENTTAEPTPATVVSVARKWATLDHGGLKRRAEKDTGHVICPAWGLPRGRLAPLAPSVERAPAPGSADVGKH